MNKYIAMAEDIRRLSSGPDIDEVIKKYASDNSLNDNERQRLVEEVNVGTFLDKLRDGSQHEEFTVASPVITHNNDNEVLSPAELNKSASFKSDYLVSGDMFNLSDSCSNDIEYGLRKTASYSEDESIMTSEDKWKHADAMRDKVIKEERDGLEKLAESEEIYKELGLLTKIANESEGITKTAVAALSISGLDELAVSMVENSKFSSLDISNAKAEELTKEAAGHVKRVIDAAVKTSDDAKKAAIGLKDILAFPIKHHYIAAGAAGGLMYANSKRMDIPDEDRADMSLRSFQNENKY